MNLLLSVLAAGAYTVGGLFMRKAEGFAHARPAAMVFGCFCVGAALQTMAMRRSELSINYILVLGLEAALALLLGIGWLGEALSPRKLAGLALILAGVMSLRLEGKPKTAATAQAGYAQAAPAASVPEPGNVAIPEATPVGTPSPAGRRRPCQNTNHAPCR
jgi:multidrug transporter EmrE-like cation transporter